MPMNKLLAYSSPLEALCPSTLDKNPAQCLLSGRPPCLTAISAARIGAFMSWRCYYVLIVDIPSGHYESADLHILVPRTLSLFANADRWIPVNMHCVRTRSRSWEIII